MQKTKTSTPDETHLLTYPLTGANFEFYPDNTRLSVVEINNQFREAFDKNLSNYPNIHLENFTIGMAENMSDIKDGSIDVVVSTMVLCSVRSIEQTLKEIQRVLKPVSKIIFQNTW